MTVFESIHKYIESNTKCRLFINVTFIRDAIAAACNSNFGIVSKFSLIGASLDLPAMNAQIINLMI